MYPHDVHLFGLTLSIWNFVFLIAVTAGYPVLRLSLRAAGFEPLPAALPLRWLATVYVSALGAQLFAYLFDLNTSALPPAEAGWVRYYFDPLFGPKTLYGAIVFLPVTATAVSLPWGDISYARVLDCWTPPMFAVLGIARVGCLLQGCCYGRPSQAFGVSFPPYSLVYYRQLSAGLIAAGAAALPVVPAQGIEAVALFALGGWSFVQLRRNRRHIFAAGVAAYSLFRFAIEFARDDPDRNFLGLLATSQWIALAMLAAYLAWARLARARRA